MTVVIERNIFWCTLNTSKHAQSKNFNFVSSERRWFFHPNREDGFFPESKDLPLLEVTAKTGLWWLHTDCSYVSPQYIGNIIRDNYLVTFNLTVSHINNLKMLYGKFRQNFTPGNSAKFCYGTSLKTRGMFLEHPWKFHFFL